MVFEGAGLQGRWVTELAWVEVTGLWDCWGIGGMWKKPVLGTLGL